MSLVVSDTTPLNYLILIGEIEVLHRLFDQLLVPPAVIKELQHPKAPPTVAEWVRELPQWIVIKSPKNKLPLAMGTGEIEAISLAVELGDAAILIDDRKAREAAESRGLLALGTIGILNLADQAGLLDFEQVLPRLLMTSFHVEEALIEPVLALVRARRRGLA